MTWEQQREPEDGLLEMHMQESQPIPEAGVRRSCGHVVMFF